MKSITSPNKISKVMVSLAWLALLIMLVLGFDRYLEKQTNPNDRPEFVYAADGSAEVTLLQNRQGHYIAEGKINDQ